MSKPKDQCCGNCGWGEAFSGVYLKCACPLPNSVFGLEVEPSLMERSGGSDCLCWREKEEKVKMTKKKIYKTLARGEWRRIETREGICGWMGFYTESWLLEYLSEVILLDEFEEDNWRLRKD